MSVFDKLKAGFALGVPASQEVLDRIRTGTLVHVTRHKYLAGIVTGLYRRSPDGFSNARVKLTGQRGYGPMELLHATMRDHRVVDFHVFQGAGDSGFTDFVYFFLGDPQSWQIESQNFEGDGSQSTIRVRGTDLLSDPRRAIFYRRGLFWEADRAVIVKGGYEGPALVDLPANLRVPLI